MPEGAGEAIPGDFIVGVEFDGTIELGGGFAGLLGFDEDAGQAYTCLFEFRATLDEGLELLAGLFEVAQIVIESAPARSRHCC